MRRKQFMSTERLYLKKLICEKTGFWFRNNCLFTQAFTRSSFTAQQGGENNEILEFVGDQVLAYYVTKIIAERYGALNTDSEYAFRVRENRFSTLKQEFVNNEALARIVDEWDIMQYLIVGKSDYANDIDKQIKVKADLFEAIVGAIAIASNWDSAVLEKAIRTSLSLDERIQSIVETEYRPAEFDIDNSINTLKELSEHGKCTPPEYSYGSPEDLGYDQDGNPIWVCTCIIRSDKSGIIRQVFSSSKKGAKKAAAYLVLCQYFELQNEYGPNGNRLGWIYKEGKLLPQP